MHVQDKTKLKSSRRSRREKRTFRAEWDHRVSFLNFFTFHSSGGASVGYSCKQDLLGSNSIPFFLPLPQSDETEPVIFNKKE